MATTIMTITCCLGVTPNMHRVCFRSGRQIWQFVSLFGTSPTMPAGHTSNNTWLSLTTWGFEVCRPVFYDRSFFGFELITDSSTTSRRLLTTSRLRVVLSLSLTFSTRRTSGTERNSFAEFVRGPRLAFAHYCRIQ